MSVFNQLIRIAPGEFSSTFIWGIFLAIVVTYLIAYSIFLFLKKTSEESTILTLLASFYNAGFMGVPIVALLFPGDAIAVAIGGLLTVFSSFILLFADEQLGLFKDRSETQWIALQKFFLFYYKSSISSFHYWWIMEYY